MANLRYRYLSAKEWRDSAPEFNPGDIIQAPGMPGPDGDPSALEQIRARTPNSDSMHWVPIERGLLFVTSDWDRLAGQLMNPTTAGATGGRYSNLSIGSVPPDAIKRQIGLAPVIFKLDSGMSDASWIQPGTTVAELEAEIVRAEKAVDPIPVSLLSWLDRGRQEARMWLQVGTTNDRNHRAATGDCPF